ncbi:Response regulator of zinc sigma-54-dependent two-component system [Cystobacter fuscus DSM 2262]|uniref:Response regulator of zinc sigma-54-dependent two-component system n=1 Tax=Cystobacter fuscus (strain ATCC 25194 / DSM 2262 / NBRC 100088 / M29) TaxID=1242864 RepID=S9QSP5_CYSF2|nr:Response regulator of zinc sigma-54-dependent two-component system [Cystobacter fuscus DSM 2262]
MLVVDDHVEMARLLADALTDAGYTVDVATSGREALAAVRGRVLDAVVCDLRMEQVDGFDVLAAVREADPTLPVLIMTAFGGVENAVEAMRRGAAHYFTKPFRLDEVLLYVQRAIAERRLREENRALRQAVGDRSAFAALVGRSAPLRALYELIERVAHSHAPVLVRGESGSGKELVARALHFEGPRQAGPFVAINCTAIPNALLESELFGHVKGSFTGATTPRRGLFLEADGGTLFLDEIGDMAPELQAKLLRVLEDGEVRAVGADAARKVDVRVVAATHQELEARVREGKFRQDLFYRLNVVPLRVPALRERREDIPLLVEHFIAKSRERNPRARLTGFTPEALAALAAAPWPGNVRELENLVERLAVVTVKETVDLPTLQLHAPGVTVDVHPLVQAQTRLVPLRQLEGEYIAYVVAQCGGNKTRAAEILGIDVSTIHRRERERGG